MKDKIDAAGLRVDAPFPVKTDIVGAIFGSAEANAEKRRSQLDIWLQAASKSSDIFPHLAAFADYSFENVVAGWMFGSKTLIVFVAGWMLLKFSSLSNTIAYLF